MDVKTYRAKSIQEALDVVRRELGPDASVLHTRELRSGWMGWLLGDRQIEVAASAAVNVPSRLPRQPRRRVVAAASLTADNRTHAKVPQPKVRIADEPGELHSLVENLCRHSERSASHRLPETMFHLFTDLIEAEVSEELARELIDRLQADWDGHELEEPVLLKARIARMIEQEIFTTGPIEVSPGQRLVALVGPTGVGKTTTIAKLAANFHLRERRRVGLITVDTYRIAAVDQLRTYADIIDLPMEVVSTPREMRDAVERLSNLDLILLDTAGRSPRDEVRIQELKQMLAEAQPTDVCLVLSSVASLASMKKTAERFAEVGVTSLVLTKLDEATGLGNLLPLLRDCKLPLSYVTDGQNVPDDIEAADPVKLARLVLGI